MKNGTMRKLLSLVTAAVLMLSAGCLPALGEALPAEDAPFGKREASVERVTVPYVKDFACTGEEQGETSLYFMDGGDIPYVSLTEYMALLSEALEKNNNRPGILYEVTRSREGFYTAERKDTDSRMIVNPEDNIIFFSDYNSFTQKAGVTASVTVFDLQDREDPDDSVDAAGLSESEAVSLLAEKQQQARQPAPESLFTSVAQSVNRGGGITELRMSDYLIDLVEQDGECYLPLQTMSDLFMNNLYLQYFYNEKALFGLKYQSSLLNRVYEADPKEMSQEFALFNYNELRFLLDNFYGLKPEHSIRDFGTMLAVNTDLALGLASTKPEEFDTALSELISKHFDDGHSYLHRYSWRSPVKGNTMSFHSPLDRIGISTATNYTVNTEFKKARKNAFPDQVPMYQEIGDTAFITFDEFVAKENLKDYYHMDPLTPDEFIIRDPDGQDGEAEGPDTIRLLMYAARQITREGSPVKNIVLDLSLNSGGDSNAALYVLAWTLGQANVALRDTFTGAESVSYVKADLEMKENYESVGNGMVDRGYRVWCLISPNSFSCGNLIPAAFGMSGKVTLVGQTSGGGSCIVLPATSASGTVFQISGSMQLSTVRNGSFYNIDQGIQPDIPLVRMESFYDREGLVEYLHQVK